MTTTTSPADLEADLQAKERKQYRSESAVAIKLRARSHVTRMNQRTKNFSICGSTPCIAGTCRSRSVPPAESVLRLTEQLAFERTNSDVLKVENKLSPL